MAETKEPYKDPEAFIFSLPRGGMICSVVMDQEDFDEVCEMLEGIIVLNDNNQRAAETQIEAIRAAKMLPMVSRGTKTQPLFDKFDVEQDLMCLCVRGHGKRMQQQIMDQGLMN
jgi:hypothetical protein